MLQVYIGAACGVLVILAVAITWLCVRQHASKEETVVLLAPEVQTSIEMESWHANISANTKRSKKKLDDSLFVLPPVTIMMESSHATLSVKKMEDRRSFAYGRSATDVIAANATKEGIDRVSTDILAGLDETDDEQWG